MPAGLLLRCAAGMKNGGPFHRWNARQFQFLERDRRHGRNLGPMRDGLRRQFPGLTNFAIGGITSELQREKFQCEVAKRKIGDWQLAVGNVLAQSRGEAGKFLVHAVFVWRLVFRDSRNKMLADSRVAARQDL